ncbi:hypothetical protein [Gryllotalpicola koreensis]|uniref:Uncharacterized protein n=1 Tax=Gryllotalpicola koreensis TaxID=993086 RepID=A0ABP8A2H4_9MICO
MKLCEVTVYWTGHYSTETMRAKWGLWVDRPDTKVFTRDGSLNTVTAHKVNNTWWVGADATIRWNVIGEIR